MRYNEMNGVNCRVFINFACVILEVFFSEHMWMKKKTYAIILIENIDKERVTKRRDHKRDRKNGQMTQKIEADENEGREKSKDKER